MLQLLEDDDEFDTHVLRKELMEMMRHFSRLPSKNNHLVSFGPLMFHMQCADPRDKVYSLLGLLEDSYSLKISVDYALDVATLFTQATCAEIEASQNLDILCLVSSPCRSGTSHLPSWVVDFTFPRNNRSGGFRADNVHDFGKELGKAVPTWHASQPGVKELPRFDSRSKSLTIRALHLDRIQFAMQVSPLYVHSCYCVCISSVCQAIWNKLDQATLDDTYPLRRCDMTTATDILELLKTLPLVDRDTKLSYACAANLFWVDGPKALFLPRNWQLDQWSCYLEAASGGHTLFLTDYGFLGFGPVMLSPGDVIILPYDGRFPIVLREDANNVDSWKFLGLAYVPGIKELELHKLEPDDSRLVAADFVIT